VSWLSKVVRPKLRELVGGQREIPDNLWLKCQQCAQLIFHRDLERNLQVCPHCGYHMRLGVQERLASLFDPDSWRMIELPKVPVDPLRFRDLRKYTERLKEAQAKTNQPDAIAVAAGEIGGVSAVVAALSFDFMGGSMGTGVGEGFLAAARTAIAERAAFIAVCASGGARMQEGILSLMQMARTTIAVAEVREAGLPYLVILADPTTGGVSASFAMLGDITIAEPGAVIGFAGARVIEQTIRESLPDGFQKSEYLREHGMIDLVVPRSELRLTLARILDLLVRSQPQPASEPALVTAGPGSAPPAAAA
jgi:acetyl-CoA carboxylase carboxyl transferase subunit beta